MGKRIMFYCHYSVGLGHFVRTFALAKGIKRVNPNSEILIVSGGAPVPIKLPDGIQGIKILNLPPLRESQNNRELEPLSDESADEVKKSRIIQIIKAYRLFKPDFLFVDHFPFGRIELKYEITALLDIAMNSNKKPKIISSIRDMAFVEKDHEEETGQMIEYFLNKYFDYLLVHSDYRVTCIEDEFEILKQVKIPIIYTGYVCSMSEEEIKENVKEKVNYTDADYPYAKNEKLILVSAGGGRSCFELIKKTIEAKEKLDKNKVKSRFLILAGPFLSEEEFLSLKELAKKHRGISLKRFIPDFIDVLKQADVSISNVGYNTTVELLLTKTKSLLIPHIKNSVINKEQLERAKKIKNIISAEILDPRELNPMKIADCLNKLMSSKQNQGDSKQFEVDLNGAEFAGEFISNLNKPCRVFFRDDDVHEVTDKFIDLNNLFSDKNIPIHYSVIPCTMSKNLIEYLNNIKKKQHNIEIGQHGWSHKKHGDSVSYEFGDKRSYSEQYEDISKGRNKIESNFEINPNLVFTPPHNRLNSDTIKVLEKLDFRIISSSCYSDEYNKIRPPQKIRDIPICLDLFIKIDDKWILKDKRELIKEFFIKKQNGIVGIMIHHKFFSDKKEFELLNEFIDLMIREKVQFKSFAQINNYLKQSKKTIAYLRSNYLPASENFIYQEIKNINQSDSCYAAVISVVRENENIFSGVEVIEQPRFKSLHTANYPFIKNSQLKLYSQFMNFCADEIMSRDVSLLHAQFGDDGLFFLPLKRKTGLPLVVSFRGFDLYRLPNQFPRVYNPLFKEADLFLVRSNSMKKDLINLGCHAEKVNVHHSSIDLDEIDAILNKIQNKEIRVNTETIKEEKRVNEKIKLIFAGRFVEKKGIFDIIKAFSGLKQEGKDIELKLIGDGPLKKQAEKMVYDLEIKDITFMTFLSHEDLIKEIKKSDIFVLPGKTAKDCNKEGIPVILMEAMACGLPVVSTFHSGIPELVVDKKSGFLAEEGNVEEICEKMRILIQNPELRKSMGISGRKTVEEEFDIRKLTPKLEKIYDKLSDKLRFSKVRREEKREKEKEKERYRGRDRAGDMNLDKGRNASHILNMLKTGKPGYFRADLHLIKGCNSHCIMCDNWKSDMETSFNRASVSRLLNDLKKFGVTHLRFHGQEPTLNKDLISIIKEAKELGFKIGLKTNALLCAEDYVRKLCDAGLDVVYFSMDSADENIHNKHRGNNISFERNINAAKYFKRYNPGIKLMINSVITSQNYKELDHLVDLAKKIEVDSVGFVQLNTKNKQDILDLKLDKQQMAEFYFEVVPAILEKGSKSGISIDINPMPAALVDKPVDVQINKLRQAKIRQSKKQAKNQKEDSDFHKDIFHEDISHEDIFSEEISDFKDGKYGKKFFDKNICYGPFDHTTIDYDGSIYPCCAMIRDKRLAMGNVHDIEFSELWNSEKYKRYRDAIASGNCPFKEECARSHDSMAALNKAQNRTQNKDQDNPEEHSLKDSESKKSFEFQKLKTLYFLPKEHLEYVQLEKAKEMIQHAYNNVLLYKQLYDEKGIKPEDINSLEDLRKLPIITKDIIRQNFPDKLIAKDMDKSKISIEQTSGSVSESVQFASLKNNNEFNWMAYAFYMTKEWKWPQKYAKFTTFNCSAGYCSYDEEKENDKDSLKIILPSSKNIFGDDESKFMQRIELLKQSNPSILHADPVYLRALALFIEDKGIKLPFIKAISSTYELLTESNRQFLETAFNCRVFDQYGCSELGPIANSCEHGNKHIYMDKVIVEIIKDKPDAEFGRIIVTDLNNYAMPLIRYDTGDIGHFVKGVCSCGRNSGMLEIDGRVGNIVTVDGKVFTPKEIDRLFKGIQRIKLYRVVQKKEHEFKIEIMRNKQFNNAAAEKIKDEIRDNFKKYLSSDIKLEFEYVDEILPMNSGKFCLVKGLKFDRF